MSETVPARPARTPPPRWNWPNRPQAAPAALRRLDLLTAKLDDWVDDQKIAHVRGKPYDPQTVIGFKKKLAAHAQGVAITFPRESPHDVVGLSPDVVQLQVENIGRIPCRSDHNRVAFAALGSILEIEIVVAREQFEGACIALTERPEDMRPAEHAGCAE